MAINLAMPERDRHVRRGGREYLSAFLKLLPLGIAWPRKPDSVLVKTSRGLTNIWGFVDSRAADLLERESDPRKTIELLPDWEASWGLPDPCFPKATTIGERQRMLVLYMVWMGGQSREYFIKLMEFVGYEIKYIGEFAPFMVGISQVGDTRPTYIDENGHRVVDTKKNFRWYIGPPEQRFSWFIRVGQASLIWFRAASGQAGVDPHLRIGIPEDLECLINRWKPAHTFLAMDFSELAFGSPMAGTP
jgi:uncharacterized protein YmfQ (DUF2313 family)